MSAMKTGNGSDNAEPKAVSGSAPTPFKPVETLENVRILVRGNSRTIIGDRKQGLAIAVRNRNGHLTRFTAMFDGVIDKIGNCIEQEISITCDQYSLILDEAQMPTIFFRRSIEQLYDLTRDLSQVHGAELGGSITRLYLRDPRKRGEHAQNAVKVCHSIVDQRLIAIGVALSVASLFQPSAHAGQRRS
jgi:hypothetical protein